jgi:hypothetical protein
MMRHLITFLLLALAVAFYVIGAAGPATIFLGLGALADATFWLRIFGGNRGQ